jgi:predicted amidohydrolase
MTLRVACVQVSSSADKLANIDAVGPLVARAAAGGAEFVLLPEKWNARGSSDATRGSAESLEGGATVDAMRSWAREHGIWLGGSISERRDGRERSSNTLVVYGPTGELVSLYRKIHLFDVEVGGHVHRESETEEPGDTPVICEIAGWQVGLTICYDLRFPELYRLLALHGAEVVVVPASFTAYTGKDHWEVLLRARAVENQCYVLAAGEWGSYGSDGKSSYGRSMIVDPWGIVVAQAPDEDSVILADLDRARMASVRAGLPSLSNRRPSAYRWPATA